MDSTNSFDQKEVEATTTNGQDINGEAVAAANEILNASVENITKIDTIPETNIQDNPVEKRSSLGKIFQKLRFGYDKKNNMSSASAPTTTKSSSRSSSTTPRGFFNFLLFKYTHSCLLLIVFRYCSKCIGYTHHQLSSIGCIIYRKRRSTTVVVGRCGKEKFAGKNVSTDAIGSGG